ncbi:MAG: cob(I)yrinic acid a,c-diamide adenosyltransferase [Candidatus Berkelbacteria bacterium]|nr:cob(I)yrinic acid a,c-diamide adenosyltransferase [Candidatus Berkelbacteria bacterium]
MIIAYFGKGKGKTTAALGAALRASGYKFKTEIIQFVKSNDSPSGEEIAVKNSKLIKIKKFGLGFVSIKGDKHDLREHQLAAQKGLEYAKKTISKKDIKFIILDEILGAIHAGLVKKNEVIKIINKTNKNKIVILTGRPQVKEIFSLCDLVSEMKEVKHPYNKNAPAIKGLDF